MEKFKDVAVTAIGQTFKTDYNSLGQSLLFKDLFNKREGHISESNVSGGVSEKNLNEILNFIAKNNLRLIYNYMPTGFYMKTWISDDTLVELTISKGVSNVRVDANFCSYKEEFVKELQDLIVSSLIKDKVVGSVYAIVSSGGRLSLTNIGNAGIPLINHNYMPAVISDYQYIVKDLKSKSPSGRIAILEGTAGTGKTHIIRSLLLDVPKAMFVLVPPDMVTSLGNPEFLPLLLQYKGHTAGPIILLLEDADKCLVNRDKGNNAGGPDNMNAIQSLLNLGDGILGSLLDVRIVATTNAKKIDMEPAILRPGRLSKRMEVGPLDQQQVIKVIQSLLPDNKQVLLDNRLVKKEISLAEVYFVAREYGWTAPTEEEIELDISKKYYDDDDDDLDDYR